MKSRSQVQPQSDAILPQAAPIRDSQTASHPLLELQAAIGNRATNRAIANQDQALDDYSTIQPKLSFCGLSQELTSRSPQGVVLQPKLAIGQPNDRYEQEADRVAAEVVSQLGTATSASNRSVVQSSNLQHEERQKITALPAPSSNQTLSSELEASIQRERADGQRLPTLIRLPLEQVFGTDFTAVKIHTSQASDRLNRSLQSIAFTNQQDIFFRRGAYNPKNENGKKLLVHELVHVMQQNGSCDEFNSTEQSQFNLSTKASTTGYSTVQRMISPEEKRKLNNIIVTMEHAISSCKELFENQPQKGWQEFLKSLETLERSVNSVKSPMHDFVEQWVEAIVAFAQQIIQEPREDATLGLKRATIAYENMDAKTYKISLKLRKARYKAKDEKNSAIKRLWNRKKEVRIGEKYRREMKEKDQEYNRLNVEREQHLARVEARFRSIAESTGLLESTNQMYLYMEAQKSDDLQSKVNNIQNAIKEIASLSLRDTILYRSLPSAYDE